VLVGTLGFLIAYVASGTAARRARHAGAREREAGRLSERGPVDATRTQVRA
jgi:hypothetical protein